MGWKLGRPMPRSAAIRHLRPPSTITALTNCTTPTTPTMPTTPITLVQGCQSTALCDIHACWEGHARHESHYGHLFLQVISYTPTL